MKKRTLALLLAAMMALGLLSACGSGTESAQSSAPAPASDTAEPPVSEPPAVPDTPQPPTSDLEGSTLEAEPEGYVYSGEWAEYPLCEPGEKTLTMWTEFPGFLTMVGIDTYTGCSVFNAAEEATGVSIEFHEVSMMNASEQFSLMCAGGDMYDIINGTGSYYGLHSGGCGGGDRH